LVAECAVGFYRARRPQQTPLYCLVEGLYDTVKGVWEERFEQRYGFWRAFVDDVVNAYLDCGRFESGFARIRCPDCGDEFLVATSCQMRGFCPSCGAKRAAVFAAFLVDEVLEQVGHAMWTFSLPKMIRPYFIHHPELRGKLCRAAYETVQEMMAAAAVGCEGFRTGMVAFTATAGDLLNLNPHVHAISPRGGWDKGGSWVPVAFIDNDAAERLFRAKVLSVLTGEGLLSDERARVLMTWSHNSGFSVDDSVRFEPEDQKSMEKVARYLLRPPLSLERMNYSDGDDHVVYRRKGRDGRPGGEERIDALDFLARVVAHVPPPRKHLVRYLGHYSNVARGRRKVGKEHPLTAGQPRVEEDDGLTEGERRARRRAWARLIRRIYEVDPMVCTSCGGEMRIVSVILEHRVITRILGHLARKGVTPGRDPPEGSRSS
jgi:ribosomal protein S27E